MSLYLNDMHDLILVNKPVCKQIEMSLIKFDRYYYYYMVNLLQ